ncbi:HEAT repeat domain-containing protein [Edaphobacter modestus]|uniref:HEAT repeat protein n=1 Tax=Edaphobacter modestus TaxID=388466 RepID=A0A4Q7YXR6_9BACT|nr:HEAT repeat domain-containing protein [Edaphobacter modestus]RZU41943.1 HEAT repeat protein [Edaphobacter modestus]
MNSHLAIALVLSASAVAFSGQQPRISNTQLNTEPVGPGLSATVTRFQHSNQQLWIGYEVPALPRNHSSSCGDSYGSSSDDGCCGEVQLEGSRDNVTDTAQKTEPGRMYVLLRLDHGSVNKVRSTNVGCRMNAGGVPFTWLTGVQPEDSVHFLAQLAGQSTTENRVGEGALATLAQHATPVATTELATLASPPSSTRLREKAAFWLGAERGHEGLLALEKLVRSEQDPKLREKLAFDLSINHDPAATDDLLALAKSDTNPGVRSQAIFWLAQKAGKKAGAALTNAIENDPDQQVKKKAVFALSQLPKDEGIPQLIHVAQTNTNPAVRKDAFFWLGQSGDPRALSYLESVLKQ